jgi:hypothetical protein
VLNGGEDAPMVVHKGQSSLGVLGLPESSSVATNFISPVPVQTSIVD